MLCATALTTLTGHWLPRRKKGLGLFSGVKEEQQNAPDWWDSEEGRAFKAEYNTESGKMARIHVKVWDEQVRPRTQLSLKSPCWRSTCATFVRWLG